MSWKEKRREEGILGAIVNERTFWMGQRNG